MSLHSCPRLPERSGVSFSLPALFWRAQKQRRRRRKLPPRLSAVRCPFDADKCHKKRPVIIIRRHEPPRLVTDRGSLRVEKERSLLRCPIGESRIMRIASVRRKPLMLTPSVLACRPLSSHGNCGRMMELTGSLTSLELMFQTLCSHYPSSCS